MNLLRPALIPLLLIALALPALASPAAPAADDARSRKLLVVIESRANPSDAKFIAALDKSGFAYDLHEIAKSGVPSAQKYFDYVEGVVVRTQPTEASRLGVAEGHALSEFLLTRGRLMLFGADLAPEMSSTDMPVLLLCRRAGSVRAKHLAGVKYDLVGHGMDIAVPDADHPAITLEDEKAEPVLQLSGDRYAAMKAQTCSYRLLVTAFQPGVMQRQADLDEFTRKSLEWFFGNVIGIGASAPDTTVTRLDGKDDGLYAQFPATDRIVLLEFFATWCSTCEQQKPVLQEIAKRYAGRVEIVAVSYAEKLETVSKFLAAHPEITWKVVVDRSGQASKKYAVRLLPTLFVIDRARRIRSIATYTPLPELMNELDAALRDAESEAKAESLAD